MAGAQQKVATSVSVGVAPGLAGEQKAAGQESLAPQQTRIMDGWSYLMAWLCGCVSIGTFAMGSSLVGQLNMLQAAVAIAVGCLVIGVALAINGAAGHKYGIPFMVQARSAFGFAGTRFPGFVRAVPAVVWFGFQSWIGAGALNAVSATMFPPAMMASRPSMATVTVTARTFSASEMRVMERASTGRFPSIDTIRVMWRLLSRAG